jgi:isopenicillin-N N-acyltransferase-like protein
MRVVNRWTSTESDPYERGHAFGAGLAQPIANTAAVYERMFREDMGLDDAAVAARGHEVAQIVEQFRPAFSREIEGIAVGAVQPAPLLFAINARTELLCGGVVAGVGGGECSTVAVVDEDGRRAVLAQNWDFHPALAPSRVAWTVRRDERTSFTGFTEAGILAKLGVNSHGVAIGINFLASDRDSGAGGLPVHIVVRAVLEEARTLPEAVELVERTPVTSSVCMTVAGPRGDGTVGVVSLERWPGGVGRHLPHGTPPRLAHTNHFVTPLAARDLTAAGPTAAQTRSRYEQLVAALEAEARCDVELVAQQLSSAEMPPGGQAVFRAVDESPPWLERMATLATVAFEVPAGRFWLRGELDADAPQAPLELAGEARAGSPAASAAPSA